MAVLAYFYALVFLPDVTIYVVIATWSNAIAGANADKRCGFAISASGFFHIVVPRGSALALVVAFRRAAHARRGRTTISSVVATTSLVLALVSCALEGISGGFSLPLTHHTPTPIPSMLMRPEAS